MKRILLAVAILALALPAFQRAEGGVDVSINFFYDNLTDGGSWMEVGDYGYCWQPSVAVSNRNWRPYSDGYWAYTDAGWTWVSYEDFGWATYHYGRWVRLRDRGWAWVPGREWGPSWVSWRTGGDYVGWAPLPPRRAGDGFADFSPINSRVDVEFDIGPANYNFIDVRYIGEPVLRERIFAPEQNVTYVTRTVNVTNITYSNSTVYNYGPDYNTLSRYSTRPIQRLSLQRETNADPAAAVRSKSLMKVEGDKLVIAAPQRVEKPSTAVVPKVVKEKVAQSTVEKGWEPVGDARAQSDLKEKMKKEDPKSVPPPTVQASEIAGTSPAVSPATSPDKKTKKNEKAAPSVAPSASVPGASIPPATTPPPTRDKGKNKQPDKAAPNASVPPSTGVTYHARSVAPKEPKEKPDEKKVEQPNMPAPAAMEKSAPRVAPPMTPETKHNQPAESTKPDVSVEKPRHEPPADIAPKVKPVPPANAPVNPPPSHDEGKKPKKNEPAASPTP